MAVDNPSLITSRLIDVHCVTVTMWTTTSCGWYTCPVSEDESELNKKFCFTALKIFIPWRSWIYQLRQVIWETGRHYWSHILPDEASLTVQPLLLHCIPHAQRSFPHSPDHNFLLSWNVSLCSDQSHIVSVLIDIHPHFHPQAIHTVSFTLY